MKTLNRISKTLRISRRGFLGLCVTGNLFGAVSSRSRDGHSASGVQVDVDRVLSAYFDTLIPTDHGPGATELGVAEKMLVSAKADTGLKRLLFAGCDWLQTRARRETGQDFAALPLEARERIVEAAAAADGKSTEGRFFSVTRDAGFVLFYTNTRSWSALGYNGPPQPGGFPDFTLPPTRRGSHES